MKIHGIDFSKMKILDMQRQGECTIIQVDKFTDKETFEKINPENGKLIVAHSETGHHHVIEKSKQADLLINKTNQFIGKLVVKEDCQLKHLRTTHTHETLDLKKGNHFVIYRREYTPEGLRRVQD